MNCVLTVFNEFFSLMNNVPEDLYLPVIWFEAIAKVTPNSASLIQNLLNLPNIVTIVCLVTIVTNLLCVIVLIFRIYRISLQKEFKIVNNIEDIEDISTEDDTKCCEMSLMSGK